MFTKTRTSKLVRFILVFAMIAGAFDVTPGYASPAILYVKSNATGADDGTSWTDAYTDLQSALSAASSGDEIWVAAGTYYPTPGTDRAISFELKNGVAIYGGFVGNETLRTLRNPVTNVTVLSGDIGVVSNSGDNSYHVVAGSNTDNTSMLDGFTVKSGWANGVSPYNAGGGMYISDGSPSISNVTFEQNSAYDTGGGMYILGGNPNLTNVSFANNYAPTGGGVGNVNGNPILKNVTFDWNVSANGAGINNTNGDLILENVTFNLNVASSLGGGMSNINSHPVLKNVTFSGNDASNGRDVGNFGGGIYNDASSPTIINSIVWGNIGGEILDTNGSTPVVTYSIVQGGYAGINNLDANPLLGKLADNGGVTQTMALSSELPAIDAGDDANCPATDQRGVARPQGSHCDIGAYEDQLLVTYVKQNATGANNGTSWVNAYNDLQSALSATSGDDEIWVAAGTYYPTSGTDRAISFELKNGVAVYGGFAGTETLRSQRDFETNVTVLSGDIGVAEDNSDNSYHVVVGSNTGNATLLNGFTITAGHANGDAYSSYHDSGAGMLNYIGSPSLTNIIFSENSAFFAGGGMYNVGDCCDPNGSNPILTNVIFSNNSAIEGGGMRNENYSDPTLTNVTFSNNTATRSGGGMENFYHSSPMLTNVTFRDNIGGAGGGAIMNWSSSSPILTNVTFNANSATDWGGGIYNDNGSNPILKNVTIGDNSAPEGGGIYNDYGSNPSITNSILYGNGEEINGTADVTYSIVQGGYAGAGNINADPLLGPLQDNGGFTQTMSPGAGSPAIDAGDDTNCPETDQRGVTRPQGSHCDIGAYESDLVLHYVNSNAGGANDGSSWDDAYIDLQSALSAASSGDEIWVAAGTYMPTAGTDRTVSFTLKNGVALYGGFVGTETSRAQRDYEVNVTILSGDIGIAGDNSDNSYHVVNGSNTDNSAILDGFTITGGKTLENISLAPENVGGGMYNKYGSPSVGNAIFTGNEAAFGGGMYNGGDFLDMETEGHPVLTNVIFQNNSASEGGGLFNENYIHATLTNVTFEGNTAIRAGGGMEDRLGTLSLTNVVFNNNSAGLAAGGMQNFSINARLTNVTFSGNSASTYGGGLVNANNDPILTNVTFHGNSAEYGGGMWNNDSSPILTNATFSSNSASTSGGGIYNEMNSNAIVRNTVLWGNSAPDGAQIYNDDSVPTINDSVVEGGYAGTGNLNADPLLGPLQDNGGFTQTMALGAGSPAINAGDDVTCPDTDQRGVTRPQGSHCDIGAYEFELSTPVELTVTADDQTITYGDGDPTFTFTYSGFQSGDDETDIETPPTCSVSGIHSNAGTYSISCTGAVDSHSVYVFNYVDGDLTIIKATPTLSVTNSPVPYTGSAQSANVIGSVEGTVSNIRYDGSVTAPVNAGTYAVTADFTPDDITNYDALTNAPAGDFVINKATPTLSVTNSPVSYNGSAQTATVSSGSVTGTVSNIQYDGSATAPVNVGTYAVTADVTPDDATNYDALTNAPAGDFVINKVTPTLSVTNSPAPYNGSAQTADVSSGSVTGTVSNIQYNGSAIVPVNAGTYAVTADFTPDDTTNYDSLTNAPAGDFIIESALTTTLKSIATQDGWVLETSETSGMGGTLNNTGTVLYVGDNAQDKQYRSILSFNTMGLPDDAVITSVKLKIRAQGFVGDNLFTPVKTHGNLLMDINGLYFGANANLAVNDFQSAVGLNGLNGAGVLTSAPTTGWYTVNLKSGAYGFVNRMGKTQFRLRFQTDDNDDMAADYLKIFSGDAPMANRPQLIVEYYVP